MAAAGLVLGHTIDAQRAAAAVATGALFTPWAWLQQALFQFYLLGRLRMLLERVHDDVVAGIDGALFAALHAPDWDLVIVTGPAGWLWSAYYLRARRLLPLALSHAALGTLYFYAVRGEDLLHRWLALF
jgi:membrane protease YdiL (CAAX protease family)